MNTPNITQDLVEMGMTAEGVKVAKVFFALLYPELTKMEENNNDNVTSFLLQRFANTIDHSNEK